jgi:hypothetical protein
LSRFRGTFHSFDPVGFAIFAIPQAVSSVGGLTKIDAVQYALTHAPGVRANMIGAVLNKVDLAAMRRYDTHGVDYYYGRSRYARPIN